MVEIAVVGAGFMGDNHARVCAENPALSLKYIVDVDEERAREVSGRYGASVLTDYESALSDVDAVVIATPPPYHFEQAQSVLEADRHLLLEKPIAEHVDKAEQLALHARKTDAVTSTGFLLRHNPEYARVRDVATSGEIGEIVAARAKRAIATDPDQDRSAQLHGHPLLYMNIHDIDAFHFCLDTDVATVTATERRGVLAEMGVPDATQALLTFETGAIGVLEGYGVLPGSYPDEISASLEVTGAAGTAEIDFPGSSLSTFTDRFEREDARLWPVANGRIGGAVRTQMDQFARAVREGSEPIASIEDGYRAHVVADAIKQAIDSDTPVPVAY